MGVVRSRASPSAAVAKHLAAAVARLLLLAALCAASAALLALVSWIHPHSSHGGAADSHASRGVERTESRKRDEAMRAVWEMAGADRHRAGQLRLGLVVPQVVSWEPRITLLKSFLSLEECEALKAIGRKALESSTVVDSSSGKSYRSEVRTSSGMFLSHSDSARPLVKTIEERIAAFSNVPPQNGELIQILKYKHGQHYLPHPDYFSDQVNVRRGGQRVATMLMYIEAPEEGGETIFPNVGGSSKCECGGELKEGICVHPVKGDAVLFWSTDLEGVVDPKSLHGSCDVLKGEKWSATKWMRQHEFH
ncbi:hypothetical protein CLOM_g11655 [Closterium sp. NIES-68]|nr:hypothetical protein CLOM_g11655 [Closterium sp. NIES-68]GJP69638.1 hypothetical protein CLOP_g626 [Closterium sp. NIES-67]